MSSRLEGRRVLVVGASAGIGRATVGALAAEGARVAAAARRKDLLAEVADETGALPLECDVTDPGACRRVVDAAVEGLGGLDDLVYVVGVGYQVEIVDADAERWEHSFAVNVTGAALVSAAAMPHLAAARGRGVYVSSIAASDSPPRRGLGLYNVSKAALNKLVEQLIGENPAVAFTRVDVGDTLGTDYANHWDFETAGAYVQEWSQRGLMFGRAMLPTSVARHLCDVLASDEALPVTSIVPRYAPDEDDPQRW